VHFGPSLARPNPLSACPWAYSPRAKQGSLLSKTPRRRWLARFRQADDEAGGGQWLGHEKTSENPFGVEEGSAGAHQLPSIVTQIDRRWNGGGGSVRWVTAVA
jgi:hypothetical protein